jgi:hypothetical protein
MPKKKDKGGRPTVMTQETINKLEEAFSCGASDKEACFYAEISHQALYDYQNKYPEFTDRKEGLKNMLKFRAKRNISTKLLEDKDNLTLSMWYLERKDKDFSMKTENKNDTRIELTLPEERRKEIKQALKDIT